MRKSRFMLRLLSIAIISLVAFLPIFAQGGRLPRFSDYRAAVGRPRMKTIDFRRNPDARTYRTRLSEGLRRGINFAGHFVIVGWGCGTGCTNAAVIDTFTGNIYWPEEFYNVDATYGDNYSDVQLDFRNNSRLLIIHGRPGSSNESGFSGPSGDYYYEWRGDRFRLIRSVSKQ